MCYVVKTGAGFVIATTLEDEFAKMEKKKYPALQEKRLFPAATK